MSFVLPTYARAPITMAKGEGSYLYDTEGKVYVDFCAGIATCSLGHCHPAQVEAISRQAGTLMHCSNLYGIEQQELLAKRIVEDVIALPGKVFFSNSGAESNDGIIKTARRFGHRRPMSNGQPRYEVISFKQSFHGRTLGAMAATGQEKIQQEFSPLLEGFRYAIYNNIESLRSSITEKTCGILLEPVQGEGGVYAATPEFLRAAAELCREHDLLLMIDEVQCGFGRCGTMMGWQSIAPEIKPDLISCAKGLGGGFPIGCFWIGDRAIDEAGNPLYSIMDAGSHGSTFGGNPLACAAALAVIEQIVSQNLPARAAVISERIKQEIMSWQLLPIQGIRGEGLLLGVALKPASFELPAGSLPSVYLNNLCREAGLLCCPAGPDTLRIIPALTISDETLREGLAILRCVISEL